jgi:hypothetical protein
VTDAERPAGSWRYAVRVTDEDGDTELHTSWSMYAHEPFTSAEDAREYARPWLDNFEVVRAWVPEMVWEVVE